MTDEERKAKDAARKREAYARRKKAQAELSNNLPAPEAEERCEERWKRILQPEGKPISAEEIVHYVSSRERAEAAVSESVAREEYVSMLFKPYAKSTNLPELLQGIIREIITLRVTLTDLIGGLSK